MLRRILMTVGTALLTASAQAEVKDRTDAPDLGSSRSHELLGRLVGEWVLTGAIAGQNTVHDVGASWVLQESYVQVNETSREKGDNGQPTYEATILIGWLDDHYVCFWFDNTEVASGDVKCTAVAAPDSIPLEFRDARGALIFTNTFAYNRADDTWEWRMTNTRNGEADPFGTVWLRRR